MKTSKKGIDLIKSFEGLELKAYRDAVGVLTIGYGHTKGVKEGDTITTAKAEELLTEDLKKFEERVNYWSTKKYNFNQNEFDALVSFTYNLGVGNLDKLVKNGKRNRGAIADTIPAYNKAGGKVLSGLVKRRKKEKEIFLTPVNISRETISERSEANPYTKPKVNLKKGSKGVGVKWLQFELNKRGYNLTIDGDFGTKTDKAVRDFQKKNGLTVDGIVGKNTRNKLS